MTALAARPALATDGPRLTTTVAREHVHRAALSEVFLTGWQRTGADTFTVTAQWPRGHAFFTPEHGLHDPLLLAETVRQSVPLLLHCEYGLPHSYECGWVFFGFHVRPEALQVTTRPAELELRTVCDDIRFRAGLPTSMRVRTEVWRGESLAGWSETRFWCRVGEVYRRLRGRYADKEAVFAAAPAPTPPAPGPLVGRDRTQDIVLSPAGDPAHTWRLRVDTSHPTLFDHPLDHVPGMLSIEAVRQAALAARHGERPGFLTGVEITFDRYIEFDAPCWVDVPATAAQHGGARGDVEVRAEQGGRSAFQATAFFRDAATV
ncbi:ScbA/BarX family gamma-butyrolactone biosynthesis protein [Streptomyces sp. NPDC006997]|uniref:ScbA/BarX family gamma-butyrolactone biosynthesis protein n=1 Tax=Streptomyces sp. NPDC006997 TaxID=3155356 RepID=UPI0033C20819